MLMAELSRRSEVPVPTIKYYLREGLLPPGAPVAATRAEYDEGHLRRLRLIRALIDIGELPVASVRYILSRVDDESVSLHEMFGAAQYALFTAAGPGPPQDAELAAARREVDELIGSLGWRITAHAPARELLAAAVAAARRAGAPQGHTLRDYALAMAALAPAEVASASGPDGRSRVEMAEAAVAGMVLAERVLIAVRRLAQEDASARRFGTE